MGSRLQPTGAGDFLAPPATGKRSSLAVDSWCRPRRASVSLSRQSTLVGNVDGDSSDSISIRDIFGEPSDSAIVAEPATPVQIDEEVKFVEHRAPMQPGDFCCQSRKEDESCVSDAGKFGTKASTTLDDCNSLDFLESSAELTTETAIILKAFSTVPRDMTLNDLFKGNNIGDFSVQSLLRAASSWARDDAKLSCIGQRPPAPRHLVIHKIEEGCEVSIPEPIPEDLVDDHWMNNDDFSDGSESSGAELPPPMTTQSIMDALEIDSLLVQDVLKMLVSLNSGLQVRHCKCVPGGPHTCMSPVASVLVSQVQSLQQSLAQSMAQSLAHTTQHSRRGSGSAVTTKGRGSAGNASAAMLGDALTRPVRPPRDSADAGAGPVTLSYS